MEKGYGVRIAVIEQVGYREWTESLGNDREWYIQVTQSRVYRAGQEAAAKVGGFLLPVRYDIMLLLSSGIGVEGHREVFNAISGVSEVPVRMASACSETPSEAVDSAWRMLVASDRSFSYVDCGLRESSTVAHIDINGITGLTAKLGPLRTYYMVVEVVSSVKKAAESYGAIVQYLGGDNLLAVLPPSIDPERVTEKLIETEDLKAGVGVSMYPRRSLALAAEALHMIRAGLSQEKIVVLRDDG